MAAAVISRLKCRGRRGLVILQFAREPDVRFTCLARATTSQRRADMALRLKSQHLSLDTILHVT